MTSHPTSYIRLDDEDEEEKTKTPQSIPVDKALFESRTVMITGGITQELARDVCVRLLALAHVSNDPITVIVSSPGGHVESGDMIHDTIQFITPKVKIIGMGWVASAGALIYVSVPKEDRLCTPNTRFLLHQPSGGTGGPATDIEIQAREIMRMREWLEETLAKHSKRSIEEINHDIDRDKILSAEEALEYGLVDQVLTSRKNPQPVLGK